MWVCIPGKQLKPTVNGGMKYDLSLSCLLRCSFIVLRTLFVCLTLFCIVSIFHLNNWFTLFCGPFKMTNISYFPVCKLVWFIICFKVAVGNYIESHTQSLPVSDAFFYQQNTNTNQIQGWKDGRWRRVGVHKLSNVETPSVNKTCEWKFRMIQRLKSTDRLFFDRGFIHLGIWVGVWKRTNWFRCCVWQPLKHQCWNPSRQTTSSALLIPAGVFCKSCPRAAENPPEGSWRSRCLFSARPALLSGLTAEYAG